jgi:NAD(P)H dehydrogenase (quinone)
VKNRIFVCTLIAAALAPAAEPTRILIAYHSQAGNTEKLAQAIQRGAAAVAGVEVALRKAAEVKSEEILRADGIVVGTPVHWHNVSLDTKRFLDRVGETLWKAKTSGEGRTAGAFCTGGAPAMGKEMARLSILSAFMVMRFVVVGGVEAEGYGTLGPEATTGGPKPGVDERALKEAQQFGERFARLTRQLRSGAANK